MQDTDIAIVGAGPIGIELAIALRRANADYVHFEAGQIGETIMGYPRNATFFSSPERLSLAGVQIQTPGQEKITGEQYLAYLRSLVLQFDLPIQTYQRVTRIERDPREDRLILTSQSRDAQHTTRCRRLVLAIGDMAGPRTLGIPGENLPHVSHFFTDPHQYFQQRLLIVGGRNSAAEAALRCYRAGAHVSLSYRGAELNERVKSWIRPEVMSLARHGRIEAHFNTTPISITPTTVELAACRAAAEPNAAAEPDAAAGAAPCAIEAAKPDTIPADFVLLLTGYEPDLSLFRMLACDIDEENARPLVDPNTFETTTPNVFVAGTAFGGNRQRYTVFIENAHKHVAALTKHFTGKTMGELGLAPYESMHTNNKREDVLER